MTWSHGYFTQEVYVSGFYQETAPNWLDFAALVEGAAPPRKREGDPFRYLDLGCGMGFHIALLAALYPEGHFIGIDFHPQHIAHARGLARRLGLHNLQLHEADLVELQRNPHLNQALLGFEPFSYVVSHGVATWVVEPVQQSLLAVASASLGPDGLFYCSYNTLPGWLSRTALHQLIRLQRARTDPSTPQEPIRWAVGTLRELIGDPESPRLPLGHDYPDLPRYLDQCDQHDPRYVSQEYANDGWQPLYVAEMHERCAAHKLTPLSTADLTDLFPVLLPQELRKLLEKESNPTMRALIVDIATNKTFRRDIFCRGAQRLNAPEQLERLGALRFRPQSQLPKDSYQFSTNYGTVQGDEELYHRAEQALADAEGALDLASWSAAANIDPLELVQIAAFLVASQRIGFDRGEAGDTALANALTANRAIGELREAGAPYGWLGAPRIGNGILVSLNNQLLAQGLASGLNGELLVSLVRSALLSAGASIPNTKGKPTKSEAAQLKTLHQQASKLEHHGLALLQSLGVLEAPSP